MTSAAIERLHEAAQHARYGADLPDPLREPLAAWLESEAHRWDPEADIQTWDASHERALAVADALLGEVTR